MTALHPPPTLKRLRKPRFDKMLAAAFKEEGFGSLSEIDIKEKLEEKPGVAFRRYHSRRMQPTSRL